MATSSSLSLSSTPLLPSLSYPKPCSLLLQNPTCYLLFNPFSSSPLLSSERATQFPKPHHPIPLKTTRIWRTPAAAEDVLPAEPTAIDATQQVASSNGDGVSTTISILLFLAFVGLSILTVGVVYIAVTDFLQKRESDKFEKEQVAKKKKGGSKRKTVRARAGPRGFGQKIDDNDDDD